MFSRYLKRMVAGLKTKICSRNLGHIAFTQRNDSADYSKTKRIMVFGFSNTFRHGQGKNPWPKIVRDVQLIDIYSTLEINTDLESDMIHLNDLIRIAPKKR